MIITLGFLVFFNGCLAVFLI